MIIRAIGNQKGSSSVLVVLTLLMLVIFGVLGMMSSHSEYRLAQKNASWTKDYYQFEAKANRRLLEISPMMVSLKQKSEIYYSSWETTGRFESVEDPLLKADLEGLDFSVYSGSDALSVVYGTTVNRLWKTKDEKGSILWSTSENGLNLLYEETIVLESGRTYVLALNLLPQSGGLYQVVKWKEIPATFDYSDGVEFEDVEVIGS